MASATPFTVRELDWHAERERLALCALLEAYAVEYAYVSTAGELVLPSPYALRPEDLGEIARGGGA